jgi:hypothetical protein
MARPVTFPQRIKRMKRSLREGKIEAFLQELMLVGLDANQLEDYKMSPRNLFEMAELLTKIKKLENEGNLKDDDNWLKVINGGASLPQEDRGDEIEKYLKGSGR